MRHERIRNNSASITFKVSQASAISKRESPTSTQYPTMVFVCQSRISCKTMAGDTDVCVLVVLLIITCLNTFQIWISLLAPMCLLSSSMWWYRSLRVSVFVCASVGNSSQAMCVCLFVLIKVASSSCPPRCVVSYLLASFNSCFHSWYDSCCCCCCCFVASCLLVMLVSSFCVSSETVFLCCFFNSLFLLLFVFVALVIVLLQFLWFSLLDFFTVSSYMYSMFSSSSYYDCSSWCCY